MTRREPVFQIYQNKYGTWVIRSTTKNVYDPSPAQQRQRERVKEAARKTRGETGLDEKTGLPKAAAVVKKECTGRVSGGHRPRQPKVWEKELGEWLNITDKEVEKMIKELQKEATV